MFDESVFSVHQSRKAKRYRSRFGKQPAQNLMKLQGGLLQTFGVAETSLDIFDLTEVHPKSEYLPETDGRVANPGIKRNDRLFHRGRTIKEPWHLDTQVIRREAAVA